MPNTDTGFVISLGSWAEQKTCSVFQTELLIEAADASASIHHLLLSGEEGVTLGANFYSDVLLGRSCFNNVPASTSDGSRLVLGMDAFLHECSPLSESNHVFCT